MKKVYLKQINLKNYRNFSKLSLDLNDNVNIIIGPNGSGKTNILESISLLSPGKGLKSSHFNDICQDSTNHWETDFAIQSKLGNAEIITSFSTQDKSRKIAYNGSKMASSEFSNLLNIVWLTPQMEGLFLGGASARRKFLDRIVYNFDSKHAKTIAKYDHFMRERNKILSQSNSSSFQSDNNDSLDQSSWLETLEKNMAIEAKLIETARRNAINLMQEAIDSLDIPFPKAYLKISDLSENQTSWKDFVAEYALVLKNNRQKDSYSGRANFGVHKSDLIVLHKQHKRQARLCSTGEQKALLISLMLASVEFILRNTDSAPILLLDELFVHLDGVIRNHLAKYIMNSKLQTFITTTDVVGIEQLAKKSYVINL